MAARLRSGAMEDCVARGQAHAPAPLRSRCSSRAAHCGMSNRRDRCRQRASRHGRGARQAQRGVAHGWMATTAGSACRAQQKRHQRRATVQAIRLQSVRRTAAASTDAHPLVSPTLHSRRSCRASSERLRQSRHKGLPLSLKVSRGSMAIRACLVPVDLEGGKLRPPFSPSPPLLRAAYRSQRAPDRDGEIGSTLCHGNHE